MSFSYSHLDVFTSAANLYREAKAELGKFRKDVVCPTVNFVKNASNEIFQLVKEKPAIALLSAASATSMHISEMNYREGSQNVLVPYACSLICAYGAFSLFKTQVHLKDLSQKIQSLEIEHYLRTVGTNHTDENITSGHFMEYVIKKNAPEGEDTREAAFVVFPKDDHNQFFSLKLQHNLLNMNAFAEKYRVEWVRAATVSEVTQGMEKVNKQISVVWFQIHGDTDGMTLSDETDGRLDKPSITEQTFPNLAPSARFLMTACSTGKENGVAQHISETYPNIVVDSPSEDITQVKLYFTNGVPRLLSLTSDAEDCSVRFLTTHIEGN